MSRLKLVLSAVLIIGVFSACSTSPRRSNFAKFTEAEKALEKKLYEEADYLTLIKCIQWEQSGSQWLGYESVLSGMLLEKNGRYWVLTAGHIRMPGEKTTDIKISFKNQKNKYYKARIFYREFQKSESGKDLAILEIQDENFVFTGKTAVFGDSSKLRIEDWILSLGHPDDHLWFYCPGRITDIFYKNGAITPYQVEHSAWSGYGGSGGPILNKDGEVVGMNVLIYIGSQTNVSTRVCALSSEIIKKAIETELP